MLQIEMSASIRNTAGKGPMRQLRMQGMTPAVVYGDGKEALKLQMETKELMAKLLKFYRRNTLVTLKIDGEGEKNVLIGEVQTDPVKDTLVHVDFCEIDLTKERVFAVPVNYQGTAKGVDLGGVMNIGQDTIMLLGRPVDIPDELVVDVTDLDIGDSIKCEEVAVSDKIEMVSSKKAVAVSIVKAGVLEVAVGEEDEEDAVESTEEETAAAEE